MNWDNGLARLSTLQINERRLEMPTAIPVAKIPNELDFWKLMKGYETPQCVMTNASILISSGKGETARTLGIHGLLDFNGMVFSDGGGFSKQSSRWSQRQIIEFQREIGVDVATTLDYPVNLRVPWFERARVHKSLQNALEAARLNRRKMLLLASVHAKTRLEIENTIKYLEKHGDFDGYAIGSLVPLQSKTFQLVGLIVSARKAAGNKHLHVYGLAGCSLYLLMFYLGADSVDSQGFLLSGANKEYYLPNGATIKQDGFAREVLPCRCQVCSEAGFRAIFQREKLAVHNFITVQRELRTVRNELSSGEFGDYLKRRYHGLPALGRALRYANRLIRNW